MHLPLQPRRWSPWYPGLHLQLYPPVIRGQRRPSVCESWANLPQFLPVLISIWFSFHFSWAMNRDRHVKIFCTSFVLLFTWLGYSTAMKKMVDSEKKIFATRCPKMTSKIAKNRFFGHNYFFPSLNRPNNAFIVFSGSNYII